MTLGCVCEERCSQGSLFFMLQSMGEGRYETIPIEKVAFARIHRLLFLFRDYLFSSNHSFTRDWMAPAQSVGVEAPS